MTKSHAFKLALDSLTDNENQDWTLDQVRRLQEHILARHEDHVRGLNAMSSELPNHTMKNNQRKNIPHTLYELSTKSAAEFLGEGWLSLESQKEKDAVKRMYNLIRERLVSGDVV